MNQSYESTDMTRRWSKQSDVIVKSGVTSTTETIQKPDKKKKRKCELLNEYHFAFFTNDVLNMYYLYSAQRK